MSEEHNVYGENRPKDEDTKKEPGIREKTAEKDKSKDTGEELEETRQKAAEETDGGGMGRDRTPKPDETQGTYNRPNDEE